MRTVSAVHAGSIGELVVILVRPSPERAEAWRVLAGNAARHAAMFHLKGDPNGRHNLPGAPMLDLVTGVFFAVGFLMCVASARDWRSATLLAWFAAMMAAGVLSLDFEAPQAARTCGVTPVVSLMAALPLAYAIRSARSAPGRRRFLFAAASGAVAIAAAAALSWRTYFGAQLHDPSVFASFSADATRIAEVAAAEGKGARLYAPAELVGQPVQVLLAGGATGLTPFERGRDLPITAPGGRAIVFLRGNDTDTVEALRRLYPHATDEPLAATLRNGSRAEPILHVVRVPAEDVARLSGLEVRHLPAAGAAAAGRALRTEWDLSRAPVPAPFTLTASGALRVAHDGRYVFRLAGPAGSALAIDGEAVSADSRARPVALAEGVHELSLRAHVPRAAGALRLTWGEAGEREEIIEAASLFGPEAAGGGLLGSYFAGAVPHGTPAFRRIDPQIAFLFHLLPLPRPFSVRWQGSLFAPATFDYRFALSSIDAAVLRVDGEPVATNPGEPRAVERRTVTLDRGWHDVDLTYENHSLYAQVTLSWIPPGRPRETVPSRVLRPPAPSGAHRARGAPPP
jgi:hypothetical protein